MYFIASHIVLNVYSESDKLGNGELHSEMYSFLLLYRFTANKVE